MSASSSCGASTLGSATPRSVAGLGATEITVWREVRRTVTLTAIITLGWPMPVRPGKPTAQGVQADRQPACASIEAWMDDGWSPKLIAQMFGT